MKNKLFRASVMAASMAAMTAPAHAIDTGIDWLKISGFGTLALTRANLDRADGVYYSSNFNARDGARDEWTGGVDSRLGVQFTAEINPSLSATVQVLSKKNAEGNYNPKAEWANIKYQATPDIAVRLGRVGLPAFLISDYLNVGYSQPWIRPPVDVYRMMPVTNIDGADAIFRFHFGDTTLTVQPAVGTSEVDIPLGPGIATSDYNAVYALNLVVENGNWTGRYGNVTATAKNASVLPGMEARDNFNNLGLIYDNGTWLVQGEYVMRTTNTLPGLGNFAMKMGYLTAGYRIGKVMPSLTFSRFLDNSTLGGFGTTQGTVSPAVRWDFHQNMALKAQWDHITRGGGTPFVGAPGLFNSNMVPGTPFSASNSKDVNVLSVGIDFVF